MYHAWTRSAYILLFRKSQARDCLGDLGKHGMIILNRLLQKHGAKLGTEFCLATDGVQWEASVNMLIKLWVPLKK
jgi:hypothetical protein